MPASLTLTKVLLVAFGGAIGSVLRYTVGGWIQERAGSSFPYGTLAINVSGCFFIGFLGMLFTGPLLIREEYRIAVLVGILGGFTTFSSFGRETLMLSNDRQFGFAVANILLSNGLGLLAVWSGHRLAERWFGVS